MKRLSNEPVPEHKPIIGKLFFGTIALVVLAIAYYSPTAGIVLAVQASIGTAFYILWGIQGRKVEAVFDCGDALLVRDGPREQKIPLSNIASVKLISRRSPFVRVTFHQKCTFGWRIDFFVDSEAVSNPRSYLRESDDIIDLRARVEHATPEDLRAQEPKPAHLWPLYLLIAFVVWSLANMPSGPIEEFTCTVVEARSVPRNRVLLFLRVKDGSILEVYSDDRYATGAEIACTRQKFRFTDDFSYQC